MPSLKDLNKQTVESLSKGLEPAQVRGGNVAILAATPEDSIPLDRRDPTLFPEGKYPGTDVDVMVGYHRNIWTGCTYPVWAPDAPIDAEPEHEYPCEAVLYTTNEVVTRFTAFGQRKADEVTRTVAPVGDADDKDLQLQAEFNIALLNAIICVRMQNEETGLWEEELHPMYAHNEQGGLLYPLMVENNRALEIYAHTGLNAPAREVLDEIADLLRTQYDFELPDDTRRPNDSEDAKRRYIYNLFAPTTETNTVRQILQRQQTGLKLTSLSLVPSQPFNPAYPNQLPWYNPVRNLAENMRWGEHLRTVRNEDGSRYATDSQAYSLATAITGVDPRNNRRPDGRIVPRGNAKRATIEKFAISAQEITEEMIIAQLRERTGEAIGVLTAFWRTQADQLGLTKVAEKEFVFFANSTDFSAPIIGTAS